MGEVDSLWGDPFVKTFVELLIMHVERWAAFASCDGKNFCFSIFAVLLVIVSWAEREICRMRCAKPTFSIMALTPILQHMLVFIQPKHLQLHISHSSISSMHTSASTVSRCSFPALGHRHHYQHFRVAP
jgi:hypothetical protein